MQRMQARVTATLAVACVALAGCSSGSRSGAHTAGPPSLTAVPAPSNSPASICSYLTRTDVLAAAGRLAESGSDADRDVVATVQSELQAVADVSPSYMQLALNNILEQVGTASTPQVSPDARLLAGQCRARGLEVPDAP